MVKTLEQLVLAFFFISGEEGGIQNHECDHRHGFDQGSHVYFSLVQMAAAYGKADLLSVFLDLG